MANTRVDRWWFAGLTLAVFAYITARAALVPLVHDETTSFLAYAQSGRFLPFASMWDANNHYFNSALGALGYKLFDLHLLALRWGSVLSYLLFAWSGWRVGEYVKHGGVRWCLWSALLLCPFMLDFFSLFRGYGPAMAFLLFAVQALLRYAQHGERRQLMAALVGIAVANGFLLALVPLWALVIAMSFVLGARHRGHWVLCGVFGLLPLIGAAALAFFMSHMGLLYQGATTGFVEVTAVTLLWRMFGSPDMLLAIGVVGFVVAICIASLWSTWRQREWRSPAFLVVVLLLGESLGRIVAANTLGINYGEDRTALHTVLLAVLALALAGDTLTRYHPYAWLLALPFLILPARSIATMNMDRTVLWPEQSIPDRFVLFAKALEKHVSRPLVIGTHRHAGLPWSLQCRMQEFESDANAHSWPIGPSDLRIARTTEALPPNYDVVDSAPGNELLLLLRRPALRTHLLLDTAYTYRPDDHHMILPAHLFAGTDLLVEISGRITSEVDPIDLRMGIAVQDSLGGTTHTDIVFLNTRREQWNGEAWRTVRHVPMHTAKASVELSFWAPDDVPYRVDEGWLRVYELQP